MHITGTRANKTHNLHKAWPSELRPRSRAHLQLLVAAVGLRQLPLELPNLLQARDSALGTQVGGLGRDSGECNGVICLGKNPRTGPWNVGMGAAAM